MPHQTDTPKDPERQSSTESTFGSKEAQYVLYNFHPHGDLTDLTNLLCSPSPDHSRVIVLAGEKGTGRRYFLEAACYQATQAGHPVALATLDLDGYDTTEGAFEKFANHQLVKQAAQSQEDRSSLVDFLKTEVKFTAPTIADFSSLAIALTVSLPLRAIMNVLRDTSGNLQRPKRPERERLHRLLKQLTETGPLVIHASDSQRLTAPFRRWLLDSGFTSSGCLFVL